jgi:hypothetical protein
MENYFDKHGNIYQIDDSKELKKKTHVNVWNENGEEFELAADKADEYKLTADERAKVIAQLTARISELLRTISGTSGCPNIDPVDIGSILGTRIQPQVNQQLSTLLRSVLGSGCPNIDPLDIGTILGTRVLPQQYQLLNYLLRNLSGGCPIIDPVNIGSILGTLVQPAQQANVFDRAASGCPNIDPTNIGAILGSLVQLAGRRQAGIFDSALGGGCPNIDPYQIGTLLGTLGALRGVRL